jgi:hypothetical protein
MTRHRPTALLPSVDPQLLGQVVHVVNAVVHVVNATDHRAASNPRPDRGHYSTRIDNHCPGNRVRPPLPPSSPVTTNPV